MIAFVFKLEGFLKFLFIYLAAPSLSCYMWDHP